MKNFFHTWWIINVREKIEHVFWREIKTYGVYINMKGCILEANLEQQEWESRLFTILLILNEIEISSEER